MRDVSPDIFTTGKPISARRPPSALAPSVASIKRARYVRDNSPRSGRPFRDEPWHADGETRRERLLRRHPIQAAAWTIPMAPDLSAGADAAGRRGSVRDVQQKR